MKLGPVQKEVLMWGIIGVGGLALVYVVIKYALPKLVKATADTVTGIPGQIADSAGNAISSALKPGADYVSYWYDRFTGMDNPPTPAIVPVQSAVDASNNAMGGKNFGITDGALW